MFTMNMSGQIFHLMKEEPVCSCFAKKVFPSFLRKAPAPESPFLQIKLQLQPILIKQVLRHWCFFDSYTKFLTTTFNFFNT